jgi:hypothetical protein
LTELSREVTLFPSPGEPVLEGDKFGSCLLLDFVAKDYTNSLSNRPRSTRLLPKTVLDDRWVYKCGYSEESQQKVLTYRAIMAKLELDKVSEPLTYEKAKTVFPSHTMGPRWFRQEVVPGLSFGCYAVFLTQGELSR